MSMVMSCVAIVPKFEIRSSRLDLVFIMMNHKAICHVSMHAKVLLYMELEDSYTCVLVSCSPLT